MTPSSRRGKWIWDMRNRSSYWTFSSLRQPPGLVNWFFSSSAAPLGGCARVAGLIDRLDEQPVDGGIEREAAAVTEQHPCRPSGRCVRANGQPAPDLRRGSRQELNPDRKSRRLN